MTYYLATCNKNMNTLHILQKLPAIHELSLLSHLRTKDYLIVEGKIYGIQHIIFDFSQSIVYVCIYDVDYTFVVE